MAITGNGKNSWSNLGDTYGGEGVVHKTEDANSRLGGSYEFDVLEYEVYGIALN